MENKQCPFWVAAEVKLIDLVAQFGAVKVENRYKLD